MGKFFYDWSVEKITTVAVEMVRSYARLGNWKRKYAHEIRRRGLWIHFLKDVVSIQVTYVVSISTSIILGLDYSGEYNVTVISSLYPLVRTQWLNMISIFLNIA